MKKLLTAALLACSLNTLADEPAAQAATTQSEQRTITIGVKEMNCQLCVYLVNKELRAIDGVISTKGSMQTGQVVVVAKNSVTNEQLMAAIQKLKYTPVIL